MAIGFSCYMLDPYEVADRLAEPGGILELVIPAAGEKGIPELIDKLIKPRELTPILTALSMEDGLVFDGESGLVPWEQGVGFAELLGVKRLRFVGAGRGDNEDAFIDRVGKHVREIKPWCEDRGIVLAYENHGEPSSTVLAIADRAESDCFRVLLDPPNAWMAGEEPADVIKSLLPLTAYLHIKDVKFGPDGEKLPQVCCPVGEGDTPWQELLPLIISAECEFDYIFEIPGYEKDIFAGLKRSLDAFKAILEN